MASVLDEVTATAQVKHGRLFIKNRKQFDAVLRGFDSRWMLEVSIRRLRATRSQQANAYYFGVVLKVLADYTGHSVMELHDYFKQALIPVPVALVDRRSGEVKAESAIPGSTRQMAIGQFYEYVERVRATAGELGCVIPDPDPEYWQGRDETEEADASEAR